MIEYASSSLRGVALAAGAIAAGSFFFIWLADGFRAGRDAEDESFRRLQQRIIWLVVTAATIQLVAVVVWLLVQVFRIVPAGELLGLDEFVVLMTDTHVGRVGLLRVLFVLLLLSAVLVWRRRLMAGGGKWLPGWIALSLMAVCTGVIAGHSAGAEDAVTAILINGLHVAVVALWVGALPAWLMFAHVVMRTSGLEMRMDAARIVRRFSRWAMAIVVVATLSGLWLADAQLNNAGDFLATAWGQTLLAKLMLLAAALLIADSVRRHVLPPLLRSASPACFRVAAQRVMVEAALVLGVVLLAALLAETTPALHDTAVWPFAFRWSWDAAVADPEALTGLIAGISVVGVASLCVLFAWRLRSTLRRPLLMVAGIVSVLGAGAVAWYAAVPAYPDTYLRSTVPYFSASITHGAALFEAHCVQCHGSGGLGDGSLATVLPKLPADLSKPHTALHTAGDMYWWISHGIPESGMPGFAQVLAAEDRWDLVNFLRIFSQGFQARILTTDIMPSTPWLGAPNIYLPMDADDLDELRDLHEKQNVLLVVYAPTDTQSIARLRALAAASAVLRASGLKVIAVAGESAAPAPSFGSDLQQSLLLVNDGGQTARAYGFLARTLPFRGPEDRIDMPLRHVEWLIDRFGYVRARWVPAEDAGVWAGAWHDTDRLVSLSQALWQEPVVRDPPDEHIH